MRYFGQIGRGAVARQDRNIVQPGDRVRRTVGGEHVFGRAELGGSGRQHQVLRIDGIDDVIRRQAFREQRVGVQVD